jgi:hypothetical protein
MKKDHPPPLPPRRRRVHGGDDPGRRNDLLRRSVTAALRTCSRYHVTANARLPVSERARRLVRRAGGGFIATSLPLEGACETVTVDLLVVDPGNGWAGAYCFCRPGAQTHRARTRIEADLRAAELNLRGHLERRLGLPIRTVTVGVIDGSAEPDATDDLTLAGSEIADHFEIAFRAPEDGSFGPSNGVRRF